MESRNTTKYSYFNKNKNELMNSYTYKFNNSHSIFKSKVPFTKFTGLSNSENSKFGTSLSSNYRALSLNKDERPSLAINLSKSKLIKNKFININNLVSKGYSPASVTNGSNNSHSKSFLVYNRSKNNTSSNFNKITADTGKIRGMYSNNFIESNNEGKNPKPRSRSFNNFSINSKGSSNQNSQANQNALGLLLSNKSCNNFFTNNNTNNSTKSPASYKNKSKIKNAISQLSELNRIDEIKSFNLSNLKNSTTNNNTNNSINNLKLNKSKTFIANFGAYINKGKNLLSSVSYNSKKLSINSSKYEEETTVINNCNNKKISDKLKKPLNKC